MLFSQEYQVFCNMNKSRRPKLLGGGFWSYYIKCPDDLDDLVSNTRIPRGMIRDFLDYTVTLNGFRYDIFNDNGHEIVKFMEKHQNLRKSNCGKSGHYLLPFKLDEDNDGRFWLGTRSCGNVSYNARKLNFPENQQHAATLQVQQFDQQPRTILEQDQPLDLSRSGPNWTNQSSLMHR